MRLFSFLLSPWRWFAGSAPEARGPLTLEAVIEAPAPPAQPAHRVAATDAQARLEARAARRRRAAPPERPRSMRQMMAERMADLQVRADSIYNALTGQGGATDKGSAGRPDTNRVQLDMDELDVLYRYSAYGRRVVDVVANDATRKGWAITDSSKRTDALGEEEKRLNPQGRANQAIKLARHMGGATIMIVVDEEPPPGMRMITAAQRSAILRNPLDPARVKRIKNLVVLDRFEAVPFQWEGDVENPNFGEPRLWSVSPAVSGILTGPVQGGTLVHASRMLYFPGRELPRRLKMQNGGFDDSVLEACWEAIQHLTAVDQGAATLAADFRVRVLKVKGLQGQQVSDTAAAFYERMQLMAQSLSLLNMALLDEGEEFDTMGTPMTGFEHLTAHARTELAAAAEMPQTILFGEAPAGLNTDGESGKKDWATIVASWQETRLRRPLTWLYQLMYAQQEGPTAGKVPEKWDLVFNPLDELTEAERADVRLKVAQADAIYLSNGLPIEHVAQSRFSREGWSAEMLPYDAAAMEAAAEAEAERQARAAITAGLDPAGGAGASDAGGARGGEGDGGGAPPRPRVVAPRTDAADPSAAWIAVPIPCEGTPGWEDIRRRVEAITGALEVDGDPHVTALYLGPTEPEAIGEIVAGACEAFEEAGPICLRGRAVRMFPGSVVDPRIPVYLEVVGAWSLCDANVRLLRRLAHHVTAAQHGEYVPHITIGYATALTDEQRAALAELVIPEVSWTSARAEVRWGSAVVRLIPLDARTDAEASAAK